MQKIENAIKEKNITKKTVYAALFARMALALFFQSLFALIYVLFGSSDAWRLSADWWVMVITLVNISTIFLITYFLKKENRKISNIWKFSKDERKKDLKWFGIAFLVSVPTMLLPNMLLGSLLWGSAQVGADLSFRAIPIWAAITILLIFPITQAFAELPLYFGYVMPRLEKIMKNNIWPWIICSVVLSLQHVFLPLLFDWKFVVWRAFMFLPFALWVGFVIKKRPTVMPYIMIMHGLIDFSLPVMILIASLSI